jgi:hypothetical protein|nr:MAG TPA: hypothetical protein [Caudoviricetes sp.]
MPNVIQVLGGKSMGTFSTIPVFDTLIKEGLYTASMTFRCKGTFPYPPGTVACCFGATPTPFVVEEISYESQGISEIRCISVWETLKRRNKCGSYKNLYPSTFSPLGIFKVLLDDINKDPNRWFVYWLRASIPSDLNSYEDKFDPSTSIYDDMYNAALYNQLFFTSSISVTNDNSSNLDITLYAKSLNSQGKILDIGPLDSVSSRLVRRLPSAPTHWYIGKTSDYGMWNMASRGRIHTWYENRPYMQNTTDWQGVYRHESGVPGSSDREWGQITEEIRCEPLRSVVVDIDEVQSERFYSLPIGRPVSASIMDVMFTGYVIERTVSGGDLTTYSIKIQPDRFYKYGEEVTDKWI